MYTFTSTQNLIKKGFQSAFVVFLMTIGLWIFNNYWVDLELPSTAAVSPPPGLSAAGRHLLSQIQIPNSLVLGVTNEQAQSIPVFLYHGIVASPDGINITEDAFIRQMVSLKENGWQTVCLKDFNEFIKGEKALPVKSFLLTFDDGRKDSYLSADPVLSALNYQAVMFIITSTIDNSGFHLTSAEIKGMLQSGRWEIGSHSHSGHSSITINSAGEKGHFLANKLWLNSLNRLETDEEFKSRIESDLKLSFNKIRQDFGVIPQAFAYPYGDYGQNQTNYPGASQIVPQATGTFFPLSFYPSWSSDGSQTNYPHANTTLIKRITISSSITNSGLLDSISQFK